MSALVDLLDAIAGQLQTQLVGTFPTLQTVAGQGIAVTPPVLDVYPNYGLFFEPSAFNLYREALVIVRARVVATDQDNGQSVLLEMMDPAGNGSVLQAIHYDDTFGGKCESTTVESQTGFGEYPDQNAEAGLPMLGCEWLLRVIL